MYRHVQLYCPFKTNHVSDSWMQYRFRQFYLDVSELPAATSSTSQRVRCYTDNTTQPNVPPNIIDIPCRYTARYVIVETTYDAPEDNKGEIGPILEICEIEIMVYSSWNFILSIICLIFKSFIIDKKNYDGFITTYYILYLLLQDANLAITVIIVNLVRDVNRVISIVVTVVSLFVYNFEIFVLQSIWLADFSIHVLCTFLIFFFKFFRFFFKQNVLFLILNVEAKIWL